MTRHVPARIVDRAQALLARTHVRMPPIRLVVATTSAQFPQPRDMAYCRASRTRSAMTYTIVLAPRFLRSSTKRIDGVLAHEFGHVLLFAAGKSNHTERDADNAARTYFGARISYDRSLVQTTGTGTRPRPATLPNPRRRNGNREHLVRHLVSHCGMSPEDADRIAPKKDVDSSRRALSPEQQQRFKSTLSRVVRDPAVRTILLLMLTTGMRIGECCALPLSAFTTTHRGKLQADVLGKGEKVRTVRMARRGSSLIRAYLPQRRGDGPYLFTGPKGGKVTPAAVQHACKAVAAAMGATGLTPHVLRHTYTTNQVLECRDLQSMRTQLGHGNINTPRKALRRLPAVTMTYLDF